MNESPNLDCGAIDVQACELLAQHLPLRSHEARMHLTFKCFKILNRNRVRSTPPLEKLQQLSDSGQ